MTSGRPLNVGVVGAGYIAATTHVPFLKSIPGAKVVAIADVDLQRAQRLSQEHGIPLATGDYRDLLSSDRIDVIDICTPPFTHERIAIDAAAAGKHIIVEKPLAVGFADALAIKEKLQETGARLGVVLNLRYMPLVQGIPKVLHGGVGPVTAVAVTAHTFPPAADWITRPPYSEHGVLYDFFPHMIDLVTWSLQGIPSKVLCVRAEPGQHHAFFIIVELRLPSDRTCVVLADVKWTSATSLRLLRFDGKRHNLFVDLQDQFLQITSGHITPVSRTKEFIRRGIGLAKRVAKGRTAIRYGAMVYHRDLLSDFLNDFRMQRGPKISIVDGLVHMAVIDAAIRSYKENRPVEIDQRALL